MAKRDVDSVDHAIPRPVPERIQLAERWRILGKRLRGRSPDLFRKVSEVLATCAVDDSDDDVPRMTKSYLDS